MKALYRVFIAITLFFAFTLSGATYYLDEEFTNQTQYQDRFVRGFDYGRYGYQLGCGWSRYEAVNSGQLHLATEGGDVNYNNMWCGPLDKYTNEHFSASPEKPFGFEIVKSASYFAFDGVMQASIGANEIWLIEDGTVSAQFDYLPNALIFFEEFDYGYNATQSFFGYYVGARVISALDALTNSEGDVYDISTTAVATVQDNTTFQNNTTWPALGAANTYVIGWRIVHDGSSVYYYLNPDPYGSGAGSSNEYVLMAKIPVYWNTNLTFMMGPDNCEFKAASINVRYDYVHIYSVADSVGGMFQTNIFLAGKENYPVTFSLTNLVIEEGKDAGVAEGELLLPETLSNYVAISNDFTAPAFVFTRMGETLTPITSGIPETNEVLVALTNNNTRLTWRLNQWTATSNAILTNDDDYVTISFYLVTNQTLPPTEGTLSAYVDNKKYVVNNDAAHPKWATVGRTKCSNTEGGLTLSFYSQPAAYATVNPSKTYESTSNVQVQFTLSTIGISDSPPIDSARIHIPDGFMDLAVETNITSSIIASDEDYCYITNIDGSNFVFVEYAAEDAFIPGRDGIDFVNIVCNTSNVGAFVFSVEVMSSIDAGNWVVADTNAQFKNNRIELVKRPPQARGVIATPATRKQYNVVKGMNYAYRVENVHPTDLNNFITYVQLSFDAAFTNVTFLSNKNGNATAFLVDAQNLALVYDGGSELYPASDDVIYFSASNTVNPYATTNLVIECFVSNDNGIDFVMADNTASEYTLAFTFAPVTYTVEFDDSSPFYTTEASNMFRLDIRNTTAYQSNDITILSLRLPHCITNIENVNTTSAFVSNVAITNTITNNVTNIVVNIEYSNSARLPKNASETLTFRGYDAVADDGAGTFLFETYATNGAYTSWTNRHGWTTPANAQEHYEVTFEYPPLDAAGYVYSINGIASDEMFARYLSNDLVTNYITNIITNKGTYGNKIYKAEIRLPEFLYTNANVTVLAPSADETNAYSSILGGVSSTFATYDSNTGIITLDYNGAGENFYGGMYDEVGFRLLALFEAETNVHLAMSASNIKEEGGLSAPPDTTQEVTVEIAAPKAYIAITSNHFYTNAGDVASFAFIMTNGGVGDNKIRDLRIVFDSPITLLAVTNTLSTQASISGNTILIPYSNAMGVETNVPAGVSDRIIVRFSNTYETPTSFTYRAYVFNGNKYKSNTYVYEADAFATNLVIMPRPAFSATPTVVDISHASNEFEFYIKNEAGARSVQRVRVVFPPNVLTNGHPAVSSYKPSTTTTWTNDGFIIDYPVIEIQPNSFDRLRVFLTNEESALTTRTWSFFVDFGGGKGFEEVTRIAASGTNAFTYTMPQPECDIAYEGHEIITTMPSNVYTLTFSNSGIPNNDITNVAFRYPAVLRALSNFSFSPVEPYAIETNEGARTYTFYFTNFAPGTNIAFSFTGYDTNTETGRFFFDATVTSKFALTNVATPIAPDAESYVVKEPDYSFEAYQTLTSTEVVTLSNTYTFVLRNTSVAGSERERLTNVRVTLPAELDALDITSVSSRAGYVVYDAYVIGATTIDFYYTNTNFGAGDYAYIDVVIEDDMNYNEYSATFSCVGFFSNTFGYTITNDLPPGRSLTVAYTMPDASLANFIVNTNQTYETTNEYVSVDIALANTGGALNNGTFARLNLPDEYYGMIESVEVLSSPLMPTNNDIVTFASNAVSNAFDVYYSYTNTDGTRATNYDLTIVTNTNSVDFYFNGTAFNKHAGATMGTNFFAGATNMFRVTLRNSIRVAQENIAFVCYGANRTNDVLATMTKASLPPGRTRKIEIVFPNFIPFAYVTGKNSFYSLETNMTIDFLLENRSAQSEDTITNVAISYDSALVEGYALFERRSTLNDYTLVSPSSIDEGATNIMRVPLSPPLASGETVYFRLSAPLTVTNEATMTISLTVDIGTNEAYQDLLVPVGPGKTNIVYFARAPYGVMSGTFNPTTVDAVVRLTKQGTEENVTNFEGDLVFDAATDGAYYFDYVTPGTYDVEVSADGFRTKKYLTNVTIAEEELLALSNIILIHDRLEANTAEEQAVVNVFDGKTAFIAGSNAVTSAFYLEIEKEVLDGERKASAEEKTGTTISANGYEYRVVMEALDGTPLSEVSLAAPSTLVFAYDTLPAGWDANTLAVYYYDEVAKTWRILGGDHDAATQTIRVKVMRLLSHYTLLPVATSEVMADAGIHNVTSYPNPFTPGQGDGFNSVIKISFMTKDVDATEAKLYIYDLNGKIVRELTGDASWGQGFFAWDGYDRDGFITKSGLYVYQIKIGEYVESGTVLVVK